jgi:LysM repeat protein
MLQRCHLIAFRCHTCCGFVTERVDLMDVGGPPGPLTPTTMRRDPSMSPFDVEADEADDVTQQFWGRSRGWNSRQHPVTDRDPAPDHADDMWADDTTGSLRAIRDGVRAFRPQRISRADHSGQVERTRQHGTVTQRQASAPRRPATSEASLGELADGWTDDWTDDFSDSSLFDDQPTQRVVATDSELIPLSPVHPLADRIGLSAVDPLLVRIGMLILVALLLVPIALAVRPSSDVGLNSSLTAGVVPGVAASAAETAVPEPSLAPLAESPSVDSVTPSADEPADALAPAVDAEVSDETTAPSPETDAPAAVAAIGDTAQGVPSSAGEVATVSATAERSVPACPTTYVAGAGDSWYRIAEAAGVTPNALLDENRATVDTVIFSGDDICLPAGATMPTQPTTTTTPATTEAPATTAPATTAPATTAPATTQPPAPASTTEVQQIIRDVWPDELEEQALQIAWRESKYQPGVYNGWCCYGVFQIYWSVHVSWLDAYGIYSSSDLLDARKNITAAYALYERAGGWGPWGG